MPKQIQTKGYKAFDKELKCRGFQFAVKKTFTHDGALKLCETGFHFCEKCSDIFDKNGYSFDPKTTRVCEVISYGETLSDGKKTCASKIKVVRELTWEEVLTVCNNGDWNSGNRNSGNWNNGDRNNGDWNNGDRNNGDRNNGNRNNGNGNNGSWNNGSWNNGEWNNGDRNSGDRNSGNWNNGDRNSGNRNNGNWNNGNGAINHFCTLIDTILVFNKPAPVKEWEAAYKPSFLYFQLTEWIWESEMSDAEKTQNPSYKTTTGYLKIFEYQEAFRKSWDSADKTDRVRIKDLPNYDRQIFHDISGIPIDELPE